MSDVLVPWYLNSPIDIMYLVQYTGYMENTHNRWGLPDWDDDEFERSVQAGEFGGQPFTEEDHAETRAWLDALTEEKN